MSSWAIVHLNAAALMRNLEPLVKAPQKVKKKMRITVMMCYVPGVITRTGIVPFLPKLLALHLQNLKTNLSTFLPLWRAKCHLAFSVPESDWLQHVSAQGLNMQFDSLFMCVVSNLPHGKGISEGRQEEKQRGQYSTWKLWYCMATIL